MADTIAAMKRQVSEEQLIAIARLAQMKGDNTPPCNHQQAKDCEYCPCTVKEFMEAIDAVLGEVSHA